MSDKKMGDRKNWGGLLGQREPARVLPFRPRHTAREEEAREEMPEEVFPLRGSRGRRSAATDVEAIEDLQNLEDLQTELEPETESEAQPPPIAEPTLTEDLASEVEGELEDPAASRQTFRPRRGSEARLQGRKFQGPRPQGPQGSQRHTATVTPLRRHRGARLRHSRRSLVLRLVRPFSVALAIVGGPLVLAIWIFRSPVFAFSELKITTDHGGRVAEEWVRHALQPAHGWNLPRLPLAWIDTKLKDHDWVQSVALRKELPNRLSVQIIERREVAILHQSPEGDNDDTRFWYLDSSGKKIAPFDPADGETDLPIITLDSPERESLGALALLQELDETGAGPELVWAQGLSEIEVLGEQDFRVWTADLPFPLLVRSGTLARKSPYLAELLPQIVRRYDSISALDLRFAGKIILQPFVRNPGGSTPGVSLKRLG